MLHFIAALAQATITSAGDFFVSPGFSVSLLIALQIQVAVMQTKVNKLWDSFGPKPRKK